jgi:hypothetical protein
VGRRDQKEGVHYKIDFLLLALTVKIHAFDYQHTE